MQLWAESTPDVRRDLDVLKECYRKLSRQARVCSQSPTLSEGELLAWGLADLVRSKPSAERLSPKGRRRAD